MFGASFFQCFCSWLLLWVRYVFVKFVLCICYAFATSVLFIRQSCPSCLPHYPRNPNNVSARCAFHLFALTILTILASFATFLPSFFCQVLLWCRMCFAIFWNDFVTRFLCFCSGWCSGFGMFLPCLLCFSVSWASRLFARTTPTILATPATFNMLLLCFGQGFYDAFDVTLLCADMLKFFAVCSISLFCGCAIVLSCLLCILWVSRPVCFCPYMVMFDVLLLCWARFFEILLRSFWYVLLRCCYG